MSTMIDFSKIISHDGSQERSFEELVCQLAYLENIENRTSFHRTGHGADGGVECYWKVDSEKEVCWQAKYFPVRLSNSAWTQIDNSVRTAIKSHPHMSEYIICVPLDRTDSRQKNKDGSPKQTNMKKWENKLVEWNALAQELGMMVEFTYWGATELLSRLFVESHNIKGIKNYFFGTHSLGIEKLREIFENSKVTLGERYSPEHNIELDISKVFPALSASDVWIEKVKDVISTELLDVFSRNETAAYPKLKDFNRCLDDLNINIIKFTKLLTDASLADKIVQDCIKYNDALNDFVLVNDIYSRMNQLRRKERETTRNAQCEVANELRMLDSLATKISTSKSHTLNVKSLLKSIEYNAYTQRCLLLKGNGGSGKSHLLCDAAEKYLESGTPALLLLGQHYGGHDPMSLIKEKLELNQYTDSELLSLCNTFAQSNSTRFIIIIDALNEGAHRREWRNYLVEFVNKINAFPQLSLIISCRSTFIELTIPEELLSSENLVELEHDGFVHIDDQAVVRYFVRRNIVPPSSPMLLSEFSNPLLLKTCCDALQHKGLSALPKEFDGFLHLFEFYLSSINEKVALALGTRPTKKLVFRYMNEFVQVLFPDNFYSGIATDKAERISISLSGSTDLFEHILSEGLLSLDILKDENGRQNEIVRFTFERYSEHTIARQIIQNCYTEDDLIILFTKGNIIHTILSERRFYYDGIVSALALNIAEKFNLELITLMDQELFETAPDYFVQYAFDDNILWRSPNGISSESKDILFKHCDDYLRFLIELSTEPKHPWNILFLESLLFKMKMPERDKKWSTYVAIAPDWYNESTSINWILSWAKRINLNDLEEERIELLAYLMVWLMSTSNRILRDTATKLLSKILFCRTDLIIPILQKYNNIDDMYIIERVYASVLGVIVYVRDNDVEVIRCAFRQAGHDPVTTIIVCAPRPVTVAPTVCDSTNIG